ncbi:uncharacterized protein UDID_02233 [Ustilago sp. UG-2017a]|nr:uncharacterized protein UDID_02233 [Ustilago sp. UG-2017a]
MSAVASKPTSIANSFYESEGRPSIEPTNKTTELARAIGRERQNLVPSFRPPSNWSQRSGHHDVVWTGELGQTIDPNDDQFSDAESWDGETQAGSHSATIGSHDATTSVYGHVRPTSVGSSIFAGRGAKPNGRRREAPPPLPNMPASSQYPQNGQYLGSNSAGLLSPSAQSMLSPRSDASGFQSGSQYSGYGGRDDAADNVDLANGFDMQPAAHKPRTPKMTFNDDQDDTLEADQSVQSVPSRNSSRMPPPIPVKAASRNSNESLHRQASTSASGTSPNPSTRSVSKSSPVRLADGTLVPKMPPVPQTTHLSRSRKAKTCRDHSPILSFDGGAAEEEKMLVALQDKLANDARRISTLGPKVKKNAPAPWELGGEDLATTADRPSLRDTLRPSAETFEKPFSRFKSRPSVESSHNGGRSPNPAHVPSGLGMSSHPSNADLLEEEAQKEGDATSVFATQRSRSKSVSSSAVGMLKGLGLAGAAAPASKKGKLTKALRLVGGGGSGGGNDDRRPAHPHSAPLAELAAAASFNHTSSSPVPPMDFAAADLPQSRSARTINDANCIPPVTKSQADLANMIMSTNAKYRDQARSPLIPSPKHANGALPSLHLGGVRSLAYKEDTLSPTDSISFASEQAQRSSSFSLEQSRSCTPPMREMSVASRSDFSGEDSTRGTSSLEGENAIGSTPAEGESTPVGKAAAARGRAGSPTGVPQAGMMSASSSQTSGSLPLPGNIEGVTYKLISLDQAREQARQKQSEWLASSGASNATKTSPYLAAGESNHDALAMSRDPSSDGDQSSMRLLKNKKSGFLMRKLKKGKGVSVDYDGLSTFPQSGSSKDLSRSSKSPMPSFSLQDEESDRLKPLILTEKPALQIRPVSSMFSGFAADLLDVSALSEGHLREASGGSTASSTGLLAPHSPATPSFRTPSPVFSEAGRFASTSSPYKPELAEIRATPHGTVLPGPRVPDSANSNWSGHGGASSNSRLPSLDAGASNSDTQSQFHSPINSPLTPLFNHSVHPPPNDTPSEPAAETEAAAAALSPPASPQIPIPEEVRQRAREIEAQIQELSNELHDLRVKHVGQGTAPSFKPTEEVGEKERSAVGDCPACGCACAEQRRLQSINEAAVLKGISVLDRGRALKCSKMGNVGKFGGYTNR